MSAGELLIVLSLIALVFGAGYWVGDHAATRREHEDQLRDTLQSKSSSHDDEIKKVEEAIADLQQWRAAEIAKRGVVPDVLPPAPPDPAARPAPVPDGRTGRPARGSVGPLRAAREPLRPPARAGVLVTREEKFWLSVMGAMFVGMLLVGLLFAVAVRG